MKFWKLALTTTALVLSTSINASIVFTTGAGSNEGGTGGGPSLSLDQWSRLQFTIDESVTINNVYGFLGSNTGGDFTLAIYDNSENGRNSVGTELYSSNVLMSQNSVNGWYGVTDESWLLQAGTYWASFEVRSGQTFSGWQRGWNPPLPSPAIPALTRNFTNHTDWMESGTWSGLQVEAVPIPAAVWLFGSGLIVLVRLARHKKA